MLHRATVRLRRGKELLATRLLKSSISLKVSQSTKSLPVHGPRPRSISCDVVVDGDSELVTRSHKGCCCHCCTALSKGESDAYSVRTSFLWEPKTFNEISGLMDLFENQFARNQS